MSNLKRLSVQKIFLSSNGYNSPYVEPLPNDASFRRYYRLYTDEGSVLLMDAPPDKENIVSFIKISKHLQSIGLRTPNIIASDVDQGLMIIEDFGDNTFTKLLNAGSDPGPLFEDAIDVLIHIHNHNSSAIIDIPSYNIKTLIEEAVLLVDWHWPEVFGEKCSVAIRDAYIHAWQEVFMALPKPDNTLVLRDYHIGNLMQLQTGEGVTRLGLLDFQDAVIGPKAYDVVSLIEDARRDNSALSEELLSRYFRGVGFVERASFKRWFSALGAHRHAKCIGIFVRLYRRDGKRIYLQYIPHVINMFEKHLQSRDLKPVFNWFQQYYRNFINHHFS